MGKPLRAHHSDRNLATISPFNPRSVRIHQLRDGGERESWGSQFLDFHSCGVKDYLEFYLKPRLSIVCIGTRQSKCQDLGIQTLLLQQHQPNHQIWCWQCMSLQTTDILNLIISLYSKFIPALVATNTAGDCPEASCDTTITSAVWYEHQVINM